MVMRIITTLIILFSIITCALKADEHYVRPAGTCTNTELQFPYASWDDAATNIQWAVDAATFTETVWVTNGVYCVTSQVTITKNIILKSVSGWTNTLVYADYPNCTTRVFYVACTGEVVGFTISNGYNITSLGGGGAHVTTNAVIRNCYFVNNSSTNVTSWTAGSGGGVWVGGGSMSTVSNCLFVSNQVFCGAGGGIYLNDGYALGCTVLSNRASGSGSYYYLWNGGGIHQNGGLISNCHVAFNYCQGYGGGIRGTLRVVNSVISNNSVGNGGGGISEQSTSGYIKDCIIINNQAGGLEFHHGNNWVSNCTITGNSILGGVWVHMSQAGAYLSLDSCRISNNIATGYGGSGISINNGGPVLIRNCIIANNTNKSSGYSGGGIALINSSNHPTRLSGIINCTIANNWSTNEGGGIAYTAVGTNLIPVVNCIIAGNWSSSGNYHNVYNMGDNSNNYSNCCANAALPPGKGNITNDPIFISGDDWRLSENSPCINAGINQNWMTNAFDLGGDKRVRYVSVDIGAYEGIYEATIYTFR